MKKPIIIIILISTALIYILFAQKFVNERAHKKYLQFDTINIQGRLEYVKIKYHLCAFKIEGIENEFCFDPETSDLNNNKIFEYIAEEGDSIIKKAYSDTLRLKKKNDEIYSFKFRKL